MRFTVPVFAAAFGVFVGATIVQLPGHAASAQPSATFTPNPWDAVEALVGQNVHVNLRNSGIPSGGGTLIGLDGRVLLFEGGWITLQTDGKLNAEQPIVHVPVTSIELLWSAKSHTSAVKP